MKFRQPYRVGAMSSPFLLLLVTGNTLIQITNDKLATAADVPGQYIRTHLDRLPGHFCESRLEYQSPEVVQAFG